MNISTKYNIGQKVWIFTTVGAKVKAEEVQIKNIDVSVFYSWRGEEKVVSIDTTYEFSLGSCTNSLKEEHLFETKEQLAATILNS